MSQIVHPSQFLLHFLSFYWIDDYFDLHSFPTRRSSDLSDNPDDLARFSEQHGKFGYCSCMRWRLTSTEYKRSTKNDRRSEEHTSELQSRGRLVCRLLLEKNKRSAYLRLSSNKCLIRR